MKYLLDSVVLIDHFNGIAPATAFLAEYGAACALSVITRGEVLAGVQAESEPLALELLDAFPTLPLTADVADAAARLRRSERWKLPDAIQAAIAAHHGLTLVTRDARDFEAAGAAIEVLIPYRL